MAQQFSKYLLLSFGLLLFATAYLAAQTDSSKKPRSVPARSDTTATASRHTLYAGAGYGSNLIYLGSTISGNMPYCYVALAYGYNNEFSVSASAVHINDMKPFGAFYIGSINYSHVFNSWFDISASVSRYQVASSLTDTLFNSFNYADLTLGFDWKLIYSKISAGGLFSEESTSYFQFRNSRYFQTGDFFRGKANISFDPYVNMLFGTLIKYETSTETYYTYTTPGRKWRTNTTTGTTTTTYYTKKFGLMEVDFGLPVSLNTDRLTIEAEPDYILPFYDTDGLPRPKGFIFTLTAYLRIF